MAFCPKSVDLFGWEGGGEDLIVQRWKLRMRAQEATLKEIANGKLRRLLAHNETFNCAGVDLSDLALFY